MTADCLRKMFNNEKRRIKAKANKGMIRCQSSSTGRCIHDSHVEKGVFWWVCQPIAVPAPSDPICGYQCIRDLVGVFTVIVRYIDSII